MSPSILIVGASSGIGKQTALTFAKNNWKVVACSRNLDKLNKLTKGLLKKKILPFKLDITDDKKLPADIRNIIKTSGVPDIVFLNAGTNNPNFKGIVSFKETRKLFDTNFFGIIHCIDILLPHLKKKKMSNLFLCHQ